MRKITIQDNAFQLSITKRKISKAIIQLANCMNQNFGEKNPICLGILNGSFMFIGDLMKKVTIPCLLSFVKYASYKGTSSSGEVKELIGLEYAIENKSVIILEDIIDTGTTLTFLKQELAKYQPAHIFTMALLVKEKAIKNPAIKIDYIGLVIPDTFVVGYGMDYNGYGRNLADIYQLKS